MPKILPVETKEEFDAVVKAAALDKHYCLAPTHFWKDSHGEIVGFFSNGIIPVTHFWMKRSSSHTESCKAVLACERLAKQLPFVEKTGVGIIACAASSPFFPIVSKRYTEVVTTVSLFASNFNK